MYPCDEKSISNGGLKFMTSISLCMIVKNEEAVISRCLNSVKELVDEIIIVDTGSTDKTKEIAYEFTDKIYDFEWINDFSAARNYAFSKATCEYLMWLDADDLMPKIQLDLLLRWKKVFSVSNTPTDIFMLKYATAFNLDGTPTFLYYRERLIKRSANLKWSGRVHEAISPQGKIEYLDIYIEHHSNKSSYTSRNLDIYEAMKQEGEIFTARDQFYYARELYYHGYYRSAKENFALFFQMKDAYVENLIEGHRICAYCCYFLLENENALSYLLKALSYKAPTGELCCDLGKHFLDANNLQTAIFWYELALGLTPSANSGGFISTECYGYLPSLQLSVCYDKLGDIANAKKYHHMAGDFNPLGELYLKNCEYFNEK